METLTIDSIDTGSLSAVVAPVPLSITAGLRANGLSVEVIIGEISDSLFAKAQKGPIKLSSDNITILFRLPRMRTVDSFIDKEWVNHSDEDKAKLSQEAYDRAIRDGMLWESGLERTNIRILATGHGQFDDEDKAQLPEVISIVADPQYYRPGTSSTLHKFGGETAQQFCDRLNATVAKFNETFA